MKRLFSMVLAIGMIVCSCSLAEAKKEISNPVAEITITSTPMDVVVNYEFTAVAFESQPFVVINYFRDLPPELVLNDDPGKLVIRCYKCYDLDLKDLPVYSNNYTRISNYKYRPDFAVLQKFKFKHQRSYSC